MKRGTTSWFFFDGDCAFCRRWMRRVEKPLRRAGFQFETLQTDWVANRVGLRRGEVPDEIKVITKDGDILGGADASLYVAQFVWWAKPLRWIAFVPGGRTVIRCVYRWIAKRRHCFGGRCSIER